MSKRTLSIQEYELPIFIHEEKEGGFIAKCSLWKDCYAQGETIEEVVSEISNVAASLIDLYREEGIKIPLRLKKTTQKETKKFTLNIPVIVSIN